MTKVVTCGSCKFQGTEITVSSRICSPGSCVFKSHARNYRSTFQRQTMSGKPETDCREHDAERAVLTSFC